MCYLNDVIQNVGGDVNDAVPASPGPPHVILDRTVVRLRHHNNRHSNASVREVHELVGDSFLHVLSVVMATGVL